MRVLHLCIGCTVMLTNNIATEYGLANGTIGTIVDIIFQEER